MKEKKTLIILADLCEGATHSLTDRVISHISFWFSGDEVHVSEWLLTSVNEKKEEMLYLLYKRLVVGLLCVVVSILVSFSCSSSCLSVCSANYFPALWLRVAHLKATGVFGHMRILPLSLIV